MTEQAQRIALAKVCGWEERRGGLFWHPVLKQGRILQGSSLHEIRQRRQMECGPCQMLPDWLGDLNAIHIAEMAQGWGDSEEVEYLMHLEKTVHGENDPFAVATAKASERAEALLRTLGLWVEEKVNV